VSDLIPRLPAWVVLGLFVSLAFARQLGGEFVWDDPLLVLENTHTGDWRNLPSFFTLSLWETTPVVDPNRHFYRPLMLVELWLDRALIDPPAAWLHRLHNLGWHLAAALLLHRLLQRLRPGAWLAFPAAAVYALHPLQNEVVAFTAARNDSMAAALMVGAMLVLFPLRVGPARLAGGAALFACALLSKEVAIATPVLLVGLDWLRGEKTQGWRRHAALGGVVVAWIGLRLALALDTELQVPESLWTWSTHSAAILTAPWTTSPTAYLDAVSPHWLPLALAVLGTAALARRGGPQAWLGLAWALATLLPCLPAVAATGQMPYRYLTVPLAGLAVALHAVWPAQLSRRVGVGLAVALGALAMSEGSQWQDSSSLWLRGWAMGPSPRSACGVFKTLEDQPEAAGWLARAVASPPAQYCCYSATRFFLDQGAPHETVAMGRLALAQGCEGSPELLAPLAIAEAATGDWGPAEQHARQALPDPTGLAPVVLSAAALRRGDSSELERWAARGPGGDAAPLEAQVEWLLDKGGR